MPAHSPTAFLDRCLLLAALGGMCHGGVRVEVPHDPDAARVFSSLEGAFGPSLAAHGLMGKLALGSPIDGCSNLNRTDPGAIALVQRGFREIGSDSVQCTFADKARHAQQAGFIGIIVFDNIDERLVQMSSSDDDITIPSVFISKADGMELIALLSEAGRDNNVVYVTLLPDPQPQWPSFVITFIVLISTGIFMFTIFMYYRRRRQTTIVSSQPRLASAEIDIFPVRIVEEGEESDETCCICLGDHEEGDKILKLPCGHEFHKGCIVPWLTERRRVCPICKRDPIPSETTPLLERQEPVRVHASVNRTRSDSSISIVPDSGPEPAPGPPPEEV